MKTSIFTVALLSFLCVFQLTARAEDIDLFAGSNGSSTSVPNLLLVFDNAANFSANASGGSTCIIGGVATALSGKVGGIEQCALYAAISGLPVSSTATVNIGVMMYKAGNVVNYLNVACTGANNAGGCLVYPLIPLTTTSRPALLAWIKSWTVTAGSGPGYVKANNEAAGATMQEAWAYLAGKTGLSGTDYASIAPSASCLKNFVVFIGNSYSSSGTPGDSTGSAGPKDAFLGTNPTSGMNASPATTTAQRVLITNTSTDSVTSCGTVSFPSNHENVGYYADEWSRYMLSQSITTYSIGVLGPTCTSDYAWLLGSMARNGGGKYFPTTDYTGLELAFNTILSEVQSVNTVFASVSLPVSVNTQGTYLNQVYMGMFRPDSDSLPRWAGNLKQYKMGYIGGQLRLQDADSAAAISSSGSTFVAECGRSFWTPALSAPDSYWNLFQTANCTGKAASSNTPDGNIVEKGGQGYRLRAVAPSARTVKTCSPTFASCTSASPGLTDFNTSNAALTDALLGSSGTSDTNTTVTKATLINWARGENVKTLPSNDEPATVAATAMRPSAHGDVVHSRPVAINFGTDIAPKVMVFYGGNDGVLRAINGNREDKSPSVIGTYVAGDEMWAFVPPEFYGNLKRIYQNTDKISTPNITGTPKSYGMDGTVTALRTSSGDAWVYATMRRGGRALYAFKVDGSTLGISLKWKVGCGDSGTTNCSTSSINNIGQTWATPSIIKSAGYGTGTSSNFVASPMLVMGGGYDATCEDAATYVCSTSKGTQIYVLDADTGSILRTFTTSRPVVGDVKFTRDTSGMATYGYAADLGGNVYRISGTTVGDAIGSTAPGAWTITRIAALGCATVTTCSLPPNRKFIYGPDVVVEGAYNILLLGSGDREKPLMTINTTNNYFFMIKDEPSNASFLSSENSNCSASVLCLSSLLPVTSGTLPTAAQLANKKGWYFALAANEQVVTSAVTVYGTSYFSTHQPVAPVAGSCTANLGNTRSYGIAYATAANPDGTATDPFTLLTSGGLPPSPVAGYVILDDGTRVPFIIGVDGPLEGKALPPPAGAVSKAKIRTYWYRPK